MSTKYKHVTKTFYVCDDDFECLNSKFDQSIRIRHKDESNIRGISNQARNKITISFEVKVQEVTVTENLLDQIRREWVENPYVDYQDYLKHRLFK